MVGAFPRKVTSAFVGIPSVPPKPGVLRYRQQVLLPEPVSVYNSQFVVTDSGCLKRTGSFGDLRNLCVYFLKSLLFHAFVILLF
jgi:hypothetical protein